MPAIRFASQGVAAAICQEGSHLSRMVLKSIWKQLWERVRLVYKKLKNSLLSQPQSAFLTRFQTDRKAEHWRGHLKLRPMLCLCLPDRRARRSKGRTKSPPAAAGDLRGLARLPANFITPFLLQISEETFDPNSLRPDIFFFCAVYSLWACNLRGPQSSSNDSFVAFHVCLTVFNFPHFLLKILSTVVMWPIREHCSMFSVFKVVTVADRNKPGAEKVIQTDAAVTGFKLFLDPHNYFLSNIYHFLILHSKLLFHS